MSLVSTLLRKVPEQEEKEKLPKNASPASPVPWPDSPCSNPAEIKAREPAENTQSADWSFPGGQGQKQPYLTPAGELIVPFDSDPHYHWWAGGQSIRETLRELNAPPEVLARYVEGDLSVGH